MTRTSEIDFRFPIVAFTPDLEMWGFEDLNTLTKCGPRTLRDNMQVGMEIIDSDYRCWRVRSVRAVGRADTWLQRVGSFVGLWPPQTRIEHDMEPIEPISLDEIKARTITVMEAHPSDYLDFVDDIPDLEPRLAPVRDATSVAEVYGALGLDTFEDY